MKSHRLIITGLVFLSILSLWATPVFAQRPDDVINKKSINMPLLERLTKEGVDNVRNNLKLSFLHPDDILYKAANFHAEYLEDHEFSHYQPENPKTKTPQLRVEYFGAVRYYAGENIVMIPLRATPGRNKNYTYQQAADLMVDLWVNSPGHYQNIIHQDYSHTAIGMHYDRKNDRLYAVQVFALVHTFSNSEELAKRKIEPVKKYPYHLKANEKISEGENLNGYNFDVDWKDNRLFLFSFQDSRKLQHLIRKRKDGLALEFVSYTPYRCGNPAYYGEKSRRSGESVLNGWLSKPVYKKEIYKELAKYHASMSKAGMDKEKLARRLYRQFKKEKKTPPYWYIPIANAIEMADYGEANLVLIKNEKITDIQYFIYSSGKPFPPANLPDLKADWPGGNFNIQQAPEVLKIDVPFEINQTFLPATEAQSVFMVDSLRKLDILRVRITSYASVEGNDSVNFFLQQQRGLWIKDFLHKELNNTAIQYDLKGAENWNLFARQIRNSPLNYLFKLKKDSIKNIIVSNSSSQISDFLNQQRRAEVSILFHKDTKKENFKLVLQAWDSLYKALNHNPDPVGVSKRIADLEIIQKELYKHVRENRSKADLMGTYEFPRKPSWARLINNRNWLLASLNGDTTDSFYEDVKFCGTRAGASEVEKFNYAVCYLKKQTQTYPLITDECKTVERVFKTIDWTKLHYKEVLPVRFTMNLFLCLYHRYNIKDYKLRQGYYADVVKDFRMKTKQDTLELAGMHVFMRDTDAAFRLVKEAVDKNSYNKEILKLYLILSYFHYDFPAGSPQLYSYYNLLKKHRDELTTAEWCSLFLRENRISFQALDYAPLRKLVCETCGDLIINY